MKVFKGNILTVNAANDVARFLVEDGGRIVFVGDELPGEFLKAPMEDLGEKALIPAFCDTHQHFASFSIFNAGLNVMEAESNEEILKMAKDFYLRSRSKTLVAFGASPYSVKEGRLVSRRELDSVCPDKPFFMVKYDGHACVVNTKLLEAVDETCSKLRGYHPDTGEMNQEAFFAVSDYITNSVAIPELVKSMQKAVDFEAARGIGMVHTVSGVGFPGDMDINLEKWFAKSVRSGFQIRVFPQSMDVNVALKRKLPRIGGCFQCALDGCFGSQDAALYEPYANDPANTGVLYYSDEKVIEFCKAANRAGLQIEMHAIGDRAFDQACRAIKAALDDYPREDHRHGIIHACLTTEWGRHVCMDYKIQLPMQVAFDNWRQEPAEYTEAILGKERASRLNPIRTFKDLGCMVSFSSDGPCTAPDPVVWLDKAVNYSNPRERVSIQDALRMSTYNGYWAAFDEKERGSLEAGKIADMAVLSENPYEIPAERIRELKVERTILGGRPYEKQKGGLLPTLLKGIAGKGNF